MVLSWSRSKKQVTIRRMGNVIAEVVLHGNVPIVITALYYQAFPVTSTLHRKCCHRMIANGECVVDLRPSGATWESLDAIQA